MADPSGRRDQPESSNIPEDELLAGASHQPDASRSSLLEAFARLLYPTIAVVATYLLLVGLHRPGGGFAAGLTLALGLLLRRLAGGPEELGHAVRIPPGVILGAGLLLASGYAVAGLLASGHLLAGTVWHVDLPGLAPHDVPSSMLFELGVLLIVVGLALDVLRTLGGEDR